MDGGCNHRYLGKSKNLVTDLEKTVQYMKETVDGHYAEVDVYYCLRCHREFAFLEKNIAHCSECMVWWSTLQGPVVHFCI
jgi:hypothetical protein